MKYAVRFRPGAATVSSLLVAVAVLVTGASVATQGAGEFRTELRAISREAAADWLQAAQRLEALLAKHKDVDYVRHARSELVDLHRRITFESSYRAPEPDALISGKVVSYKPKSGRIKLVYTQSTMSDFLDPNKPKPVEQPKRRRKTGPGMFPTLQMPERPQIGPVYRPRIHPATFRSCKIEVTGSQYQSTELLTGINNEGMFRTFAGKPRTANVAGRSTWVPTYVLRHVGKKESKLSEKDWLAKTTTKNRPPKSLWPMKPYGKYSIVLDVKPTSLLLKINRKTAARCKWRGEVVGGIGITDASFEKMTITGQVEPSWIQGLIDDHRQAALDKFTSDYKPESLLPKWLFAKPTNPVDTSALKQRRYYPGKEKPKDLRAVHGVLDDLSKGRSTRVLFRMALWKDDKVPPLVLKYLRSYAYMVDGSYKKSIDLGEQVVAADPEFSDGRIVLGKSLLRLRRNADAEAQFRAVLQLQPMSAGTYCDLAMSLMRQRKAPEARTVLGDATSRGLGNDYMQSMRRIIDRVIDGPKFGTSHTVETAHYRITSDIDERVCRDAGKVLEGALEFYCQMLGNVRDQFDGQKFQVYLFAGQKGYSRYLEGLDLSIPIHTAGLYSPELQQLLIWNLPEREDMLRTIRHEGFHQYFDQLVTDMPIWLNEGLAEYVEVSRYKAGKPQAGIVRQSHVRALALVRSRGSIESFLKMTPRQFYGPTAALNYSKSWALVRYLRGGKPQVRAVFDRLVAALAAGKSRDEALEDALEGVDMKRLSDGFWASVDKLIGKK